MKFWLVVLKLQFHMWTSDRLMDAGHSKYDLRVLPIYSNTFQGFTVLKPWKVKKKVCNTYTLKIT